MKDSSDSLDDPSDDINLVRRHCFFASWFSHFLYKYHVFIALLCMQTCRNAQSGHTKSTMGELKASCFVPMSRQFALLKTLTSCVLNVNYLGFVQGHRRILPAKLVG